VITQYTVYNRKYCTYMCASNDASIQNESAIYCKTKC